MSSSSFIFNIANKGLRLETANDVQKLFSDSKIEELKELVLTSNTFGIDASKALGGLLSRMKNLKATGLSAIFASRPVDEVLIALPSVFSPLLSLDSLIELNFSDNAVGAQVYRVLVPLLSQLSNLQIIKLVNNGFGPEAGKAIAEAIQQLASKRRESGRPSALRVLLCARNRLEDGSASAWGEAIAAHPNLQKVKMSNNGFREDGIKAIAKGLAKCSDLRYLNLRDSTSRNEDNEDDPEESRGSWLLADAIRNAKRLEYLDLSDCYLTDVGSLEIVNALGENPYPELHSLLLQGNDMNEGHYEKLLTVIQDTLPKLKVLVLADNDDLEDNEAIDALKEFLEDPTRKGQLITDDQDVDALIKSEDAKDETTETRFVGDVPIEVPPVKKEEDELDELAKLMGAKLKIENQVCLFHFLLKAGY
ncbi:hypothetical protein Clacol_005709 [Clathrus columnatus]|uniref:Ran GTPase-activating protein 1 n=1 Tax=Clathrus columnatus TaxID=1419009 RepID=A0AAV5AA29_9AGAM|nr:hypothetical protein Clacol_005709 [Clathrus columnatus]